MQRGIAILFITQAHKQLARVDDSGADEEYSAFRIFSACKSAHVFTYAEQNKGYGHAWRFDSVFTIVYIAKNKLLLAFLQNEDLFCKSVKLYMLPLTMNKS